MPGREWPQQAADLTIPIFVRASATKSQNQYLSRSDKNETSKNTPWSFRGGVADAHIGKRRLVDYGTTAERILQTRQGVGLTATAPYLVVLAPRCYHEHLHAARPAELMLSGILHCPRAYGSRDRHRHRRHQVSEILPHHSLGLPASSRGHSKELPFAGNPREQRSLGLRIQKAIEVAVCQQEVQKELSQRGPLDT